MFNLKHPFCFYYNCFRRWDYDREIDKKLSRG